MPFVLCFTCVCLISYATFGFGIDTSSVSGNTVDGNMLIKIGRKTKHPLLTIIGMAIRNMHPCAEWTEWSKCTAARPGSFGTINRTRTCTETKSDGNITFKIQEDTRLCEGFCPSDYNWTVNGFCFKLYNVTKVWDDAETLCQNDGGHVVFIESEKKFGDFKKMLEGFGNSLWLDGRRKDVSSPWKNVQGATMTKFFWYSSQPSNGSTELCIVTSSANSREWYDVECTSSIRYTLCEIRQD